MRAIEAPVVALVGVRLFEDTEEFDFFVRPGETVALVGAGGSGKSTLLDVLRGEVAAVGGRIAIAGSVASPGKPRRTGETPFDVVARSSEGREYEGAAQLLTAFGLWEYRDISLRMLSDTQVIACSIIESVQSEVDVCLFDTHFDLLDPATRFRAIEAVRETYPDCALVIATACTDIAETADKVAVLKEGTIVFMGTPEQVVESVGEREYLLEVSDKSAANQMVDAFEVEVYDAPEGIRIQARDGQEEPARLLAQGYGLVKAVWIKRPDFASALRALLEQ